MAARMAVSLGVLGACLCGAGLARAQTWEGNRTTPHLGEVLVVDATGESGWPYGSEDLDPTVDVRSVYGARGDSRAWFRWYLSTSQQPPTELTTYLFVDADADPSSGGPAVATDVAPELAADPSSGGYEFLVVTPADGTAPSAWEWDGAQWVDAGVQPNRIESEVGTDVDPLLIGAATHGYVQTMIDFGVVGIDASCNADFFFRSTSGDAALGDGDLEVGEVTPCVPRDSNADQVPDVLVVPRCTDDADCPGDGLCVDGACVIPVGCAAAADSAATEDCVDGVCVAQGGDACADATDCAGLICENGTCVACTSDAECGGGRCGPDGRCVEAGSTPPASSGAGGAGPEYGLELNDGDEVRGGACKCQAPGRSGERGAWLAVLAAAALLSRRRFTRS